MKKQILFVLFAAPVIFGAAFVVSQVGASNNLSYTATTTSETSAISSTTVTRNEISTPAVPQFVVTHIPTPKPLRGIYMTSCVAATPSWRAKLAKMIEETELNAVVIDIKDYTGMISFPTEDKVFPESTNGCFVEDMREFIGELHEKDIYVIGRVQVFQDKTYTLAHPGLAVKKKDGTTWKDFKGISFIDVGAKPYWEHVAKLAKYSHSIGFDEINFDYVRYPSDGNMKDIWFSQSGSSTKQEMLEEFFVALRSKIPQDSPVISADLFGMVTTNTDDLNIGQVLERALPHFDYIMPMVYPSHYPPNFNGWKNPNLVAGKVIEFSMGRAVERANKMEESEVGFIASSSTPKFVPTGKYRDRLRPWLQDFDYGGTYDAAKVREQIDATYKIGLDSWILWDPGNTYTREALKLQ